jgi:epoxyqueuosine reductase QueG
MADKLPARLSQHPTVRNVQSRKTPKPGVLDADWLREICLAAGADDVAFASVDNPGLASELEHVEAALPGTKSYISLVVRMNRDNVRSTARSVANQEFHRSGELLNEAAHRIVRRLQDAGYRALNPSATFPMEMDNFPGRIWVVAHKPVAVAAGLGAMGIHRNVIHPKFGNFILLGTILVDAPISSYGEPLDYSPCLECKLCVAACPVGAIGKDGDFDFVSCSVHAHNNYREFVTSPTAGSRRLLFTPLGREGPVRPVGCCERRVRPPVRDARIAGIRTPLG